MINVINLATGSAADVGAALETIGFTKDSSDSTKYYYDNDSNHKIYFKVTASGSNATIRAYNSANTALGNINMSTATPCKLCYEQVGDSLLFGFAAISSANKLHFGIIEPVSENDDWMYIYPYNSVPINGRTEATFTIASQCFQNSASGVWIVKAYDGSRFTDNLFLTAISPSVPTYSDTTAINYSTAEIDGEDYRVLNLSNNINGSCKFVIKLPSE